LNYRPVLSSSRLTILCYSFIIEAPFPCPISAMSPSLSTPNTSLTPSSLGRWIVTEFGKPSVLKWEAFDPMISLSAGDVLIRILVAGIAGVDNIQRCGGYPHPLAKNPGFTPGYDLVGEIIALGDAVPKERDLQIGDRVTALSIFGAHATHIVLPFEEVMKLQKDDDPLKMCALPLNYMTAWGMLKHSGVDLPPGSSILIGSASGGLGTAVAQLVKAFDLGIKMIGTCSPSKFEYVRSLGVEPLDRNAPDLVKQVRALTDGKGVDVAYDGVCSEKTVQDFLAATKQDVGRVVVFGVMGSIAADGSKMLGGIDELFKALLQPPRVRFWALDIEFPKKKEVAEFYAIVEKVREGKLDPTIAKLLRLSDAVEAHELLINGSAIKGKMLFVVDENLAKRYGM
jgi:NADPH2:quinone reductase